MKNLHYDQLISRHHLFPTQISEQARETAITDFTPIMEKSEPYLVFYNKQTKTALIAVFIIIEKESAEDPFTIDIPVTTYEKKIAFYEIQISKSAEHMFINKHHVFLYDMVLTIRSEYIRLDSNPPATSMCTAWRVYSTTRNEYTPNAFVKLGGKILCTRVELLFVEDYLKSIPIHRNHLVKEGRDISIYSSLN